MAYLDYLRLTTFDLPAYAHIAAELHLNWGHWKPGKFLQYVGQKNDNLFHGSAIQNDRQHFMIQASGEMAHELYLWLSENYSDYLGQFACTRVDLQRTVEQPQHWVPRDVYTSVRDNDKVTSIIESETGSTVYIGNRTSDTFVRIYEKKLDRDYLRFEFELKGKMAARAWHYLRQSASIDGMYNGILVNHAAPNYVKEWFLFADTKHVVMEPIEHTYSMHKKLLWLESLVPTFERMMNDHEIGERTREIIAYCARYSATIDSTPTSGVES